MGEHIKFSNDGERFVVDSINYASVYSTGVSFNLNPSFFYLQRCVTSFTIINLFANNKHSCLQSFDAFFVLQKAEVIDTITPPSKITSLAFFNVSLFGSKLSKFCRILLKYFVVCSCWIHVASSHAEVMFSTWTKGAHYYGNVFVFLFYDAKSEMQLIFGIRNNIFNSVHNLTARIVIKVLVVNILKLTKLL